MSKEDFEYGIHKCCICGKEFEGYGNNPWPLKEEGRCCDECNRFVIEARIYEIYIQRKNEEKKEE